MIICLLGDWCSCEAIWYLNTDSVIAVMLFYERGCILKLFKEEQDRGQLVGVRAHTVTLVLAPVFKCVRAYHRIYLKVYPL
ncbi:hypothetical protein FHG87_017900 [Trinorchestia longiramus]|nr:hypothetical protein FHG87_017900 [Trinorchestia longiramus]